MVGEKRTNLFFKSVNLKKQVSAFGFEQRILTEWKGSVRLASSQVNLFNLFLLSGKNIVSILKAADLN